MLNKKNKIIIFLLFVFTLIIFPKPSFSKYVIEDVKTVAKLDIDRCKPKIELMDITTSNVDYPNYANKTHTITGHLKITEKNIIKNNLSTQNIKILVSNHYITPNFKSFYLLSQNSSEKIYEFSFTNTTSDGALVIFIPEGIIEDKSGVINEQKYFSSRILIDNTAPIATFKEIPSSNSKSKAQITSNEQIRKLAGWEISNNNLTLSKEFTNYISYTLPITDFAQNSSEILIDIKSATNILLEYGTFDYCSYETLVSSGQISSLKTISSNSICKTEAIFIRLAGNISNPSLQARYYSHTYWGSGAYIVCPHSELGFNHGYNNWINVGSEKTIYYNNSLFSQLGGYGLNTANMVCSNKKDPIPSNIAAKYPFGISSIQFRLKDNANFCVVYQAYIKDVGWLKASCDGEENFYKHDKPISAFRINIVPKSEKQYLINFWNRNS